MSHTLWTASQSGSAVPARQAASFTQPQHHGWCKRMEFMNEFSSIISFHVINYLRLAGGSACLPRIYLKGMRAHGRRYTDRLNKWSDQQRPTETFIIWYQTSTIVSGIYAQRALSANTVDWKVWWRTQWQTPNTEERTVSAVNDEWRSLATGTRPI